VARDDPATLAHSALALGFFGEDIGAAEAIVDRALALNPSFARGWYHSSIIRFMAGEADLAIEHAEIALRLSPRGRVGSAFNIVGAAHLVSRRFDASLPKLLLAIQDEPDYPSAYRFLAACYAHLGRIEEAREVVARLRTVTPLVVHDLAYLRNPEQRALVLSGLRMSVGASE
jgi:adenylate cyclase